MLGNFPQAFSHLAFISTAVQLNEAEAQRRARPVSREGDQRES